MAKIKLLVFLAVVGGAVFLALQFIPPYFNNYQFQDTLDDIARRNSYTQKTEDDVRQIVIDQAMSHDIHLKEDQVEISRTRDGMAISVHYRVHVDYVVGEKDLDFTTVSANKRL